MADHAAAVAHALAGKGEKTVRRGALPLRIAGRKMRSNIAFGESTKDRIDERMQRDIRIGMTGDAARMGDTNSTQHDMIALDEGMDVEPIAGPNV